jgi:hypothetical protein
MNDNTTLLVSLQAVYTSGAMSSGKTVEFSEVFALELNLNPAVIALETALNRQLTTAECDYLFSFTPTSATIHVDAELALCLEGVDDTAIL